MAGIVLIGLQARIGKRPGKLSARQLRLSLAWLGLAWLGLAWLGLAWLGLAWQNGGQNLRHVKRQVEVF